MPQPQDESQGGMVDPRDLTPNSATKSPAQADPEINLGAGKRDKDISTVDPKREVKEPPKQSPPESEEERLPGKDETLH